MVVENHSYHQLLYRKNLHNIHHHHHQQRSAFLPMLCSRPSIKDVSLPQWRDRASLPSCDDPLSPRIGCMGQVKRKNNKIAGFPTHRLSFTSKSSTTSSTSSSPSVKYSKLKNLFYGKNLITTATTTTSATTISSCGTRQRVALLNCSDLARKERCSKSENLGCSISIDEMDPPLPVVRRVQKKVEEGGSTEDNSLWKRRSGGHELKSLQLRQIHHPRICLQPTSV